VREPLRPHPAEELEACRRRGVKDFVTGRRARRCRGPATPAPLRRRSDRRAASRSLDEVSRRGVNHLVIDRLVVGDLVSTPCWLGSCSPAPLEQGGDSTHGLANEDVRAGFGVFRHHPLLAWTAVAPSVETDE